MDLNNIDTLRIALKNADNLFFTFWVRYNNYQGNTRKLVLK